MNKKKIALLALSVCLVAILAAGGSLAYLFDTDAATNVFTTGNVEIGLHEIFGDQNPETPEKLLPATGSAQNDTLRNGVTKKVWVSNDGSEEAYVRVHIAIPNILDDGADTFDAGNNVLHFNFDKNSIGEGKWDWSKSTGAPYQGDWNYYEETIDGIKYNVYVVTYESALKAYQETAYKAMDQVYLDSKVTNEDLEDIIEVLGEDWKILVVAEGSQKEGFDNAYDSLNASFGVPGSYDVDWTAATAVKG